MTSHRVSSHLRIPLFRSGYALAANTVIASGLGALYWVLAARLLTPEEVGVGAGLVAAMTLLATLAGLSLDYALNRFVPPAGRATGRLIAGAYAVAAPLSGLAAAIFIVGLDWWAPGLSVLRTSTWSVLGFVGATMLWSVFVLQDAALAGLRRATWLPIENGIYGVAKLGLLAVLVAASAQFPIFASWTLPLVVIVIPINWLMFRRAIPAHVAETSAASRPLTARQVGRYAIRDYAGTTLSRATESILPLIVLELVGAEANAYFYLAWTIAYALHLLSRATGVALITEGALEPTKLTAYARQVIVQTAALVVPVVVVAVAGAPLLLSVFGPAYADEGTAVLRLLVLAAVPNMVVTLFIAIARVERRMRSVVYVNGTVLLTVIPLSILLLPRLGVTGVGWAWLAVQTGLAVVLLATRLRPVWLPLVASLPGAAWLASQVGPSRRIGRESAAAATLVPDLLVGLRHEHPMLSLLRLGRTLPTELDLVVATLVGPDEEPQAVIKLAATPGAGDSVRLEAATLRDLQRVPSSRGWSRLVPELLAEGTVDELPYFIEQFVPGRAATEAATDARRRDSLLSAAAAAIAPLHAATATPIDVASTHIDRWVAEPLADLVGLLEGGEQRRRSVAAHRLGTALDAELRGTATLACRIHGDYWLGNLIVDDAGAVTGIVDWAQSEDEGLAALDVLHLILTTRVLRHDQPFGPTVLAALSDPAWTPAEQALLATTQQPGPPLRTLIQLTWLRHVASNVRKSYRYRRSAMWMAQNVDEVLVAMQRDG